MESFAALEQTEDGLGPVQAGERGSGGRAARVLRPHLADLALGLACILVISALLASV